MATKEVYQEKAEAQLREWRAELDKLKARADKQKAEAKGEYQDVIEQLQERQDRAEHRLGQIRASSASAWEDLKGGMDAALAELKAAIDRASARF